MARETGLEPAASAVTGRRSNQLSYSRKLVKRAGEPAPRVSRAVHYGFGPVKSSTDRSFFKVDRPRHSARTNSRTLGPPHEVALADLHAVMAQDAVGS